MGGCNKSGIYKIQIDKHFYIGSAVDLTDRKSSHKRNLERGRHCNNKMQNVFNKYSCFIFEILEQCDKNKLLEREQHYIDILSPDLNIRRIAKSNFGLKASEVTKQKMSIAAMGVKKSYNHRKNISLAQMDDLTNKRFGLLVATKRDFNKKGVWWICACDCGKVKTIRADHLKLNKVQSCGCFRSKKLIERNKSEQMRKLISNKMLGNKNRSKK